jgi:hypothetical protein
MLWDIIDHLRKIIPLPSQRSSNKGLFLISSLGPYVNGHIGDILNPGKNVSHVAVNLTLDIWV